MSYGTIYRLEFSDVDNRDLRLDILKKDYSGAYEALTGTDRPVILGSLNNDEDKFSPIRGQRLIINLIADGVFSLDSIYSEADDAFMVEFYRDEEIVFIGFLVQDDCREDYQDAPYVVTLEAIDNLGLLKDIDLVDHAGNKFDGKENIAGYLLGALKQTGLDIPIRMYFNLVEESFSEGWHAFQETFVDAETWKKNDTDFMNCYEVLEKILVSCGCILFQAHGRWNVVRVKELQKETLQWRQMSSEGISNGTETVPAGIGQGLGMTTVNLDQIKSVIRPFKNVRMVFNYNYPDPLIPNLNLMRGNLIPLPPLTTSTQNAYTMPFWEKVIRGPGVELVYYALAELDNAEREKVRTIILSPFAGSLGEELISAGVPVTAGDMIEVTFEYRMRYNQSGFNQVGAFVYIDGGVSGLQHLDDGNNAQLETAIWRSPRTYLNAEYESDQDNRDWKTYSAISAPIVFDGMLRIGFYPVTAAASGVGGQQLWIRNIRFTYKMNDIGIGVNGHKWDVSQNTDIKNTTEREVFLSDHSRKIAKGVLFRNDRTTLTTLWHERGDASKKYDFMEAAALGIYNAYFRRLVKMEGSFRGLDNDNEEEKTISLLNMFYFDTMQGRFFVPLSIQEIDFRNMLFRAYLAEHRSELSSGEPNLNGDQQADSREFSYTYEDAG